MTNVTRNVNAIKFLIVFFFIGLNIDAIGQVEVSGRIVDRNIGAVPFTMVILKSKVPIHKNITALADNNGYFLVKNVIPGNYTFSATMMGFKVFSKELQVVASKNSLIIDDVMLIDEALSLEGVNITATKTKKIIEQRPDRIIMNVAGSVLAAGNDAYNLLSIAPAVQLINGRLSLQGKSNVLILLDGKKIPGASLESILASIPGDQIDRIELITKPSSRYDADASGGVIQILTKRDKQQGWNANITGNYNQGRYAGAAGNAGFRYNSKKVGFSLNGGYSGRGDLEEGYSNRDLYRGTEKVADFKQTFSYPDKTLGSLNISTSINYHLSAKSLLGADVDYIKSSINAKGNVYSNIIQLADLSTGNTVSDNKLKTNVDFSNYNLYYKTKFDTIGSDLSLNANYSRYLYNTDQQFSQVISPSDVSGASLFKNVTRSVYDIYTTSVDYTKAFSGSLKFDMGAKYALTNNNSNQFFNGEMSSDIGYKEAIYAGYLKGNQTWGKFSVQAGLRLEHTAYKINSFNIDSNYTNVFFNMLAEYKVTSDYSTSVSYRGAINRPSFNSLIPYMVFRDSYTSFVGNPLLKPELAHDFSWTNIYKKYSASLSYTRTTNKILPIYNYDPENFSYSETVGNFKQGTLWSLNVIVPIKFSSWWENTSSVNGMYQRINYSDPSSFLGLQLRDKYSFTANTFNSFKLSESWSAELAAIYYAPSILGLFNVSQLSNVTLGVKKVFLNKQAFVKVGVSDLFWKNKVTVTSNYIPIVETAYTRNDTRRVRISFQYIFGKKNLKPKKGNNSGNDTEKQRLGL
ncbi:TonB-dependent receptor family protein [Pedobacter sp. PLR]|uniref:TonB-dependent receptor family protein n=1 Tax=Pedobacter sp. PLR TaxID=2994465 RepID=UPI002246C0B7|nr:TonB-dependent receptor family protein [Pedobacter sp. PLR]MCX2453354.1 TonB-dependent receptor family protein [Pedobacter sp. PLR]